MTLNDTFENNNRGDKSKTIRRGYFMKYFLTILLVINGIFGSVFAQQYPVRLVPVVFPPYNVRLSDYALNSEPKLQLQVLMTDLLEPPHKTGIKFSLESGGRVIAVSTPFVNGLDPFLLQPGNNISLSNLDLKPLFKLENLSGISPSNYARALPDGLYQYCFQAYDFYTKNNLSQKSCASVYQVLYEPPFLNLPQKGEKVTKKAEFQGLVFNWSPRQNAPNTKYIFTLKEIWDKQRDPESAFLAARVLWKEETFAPSLYYGIDKTQLIPGKRYAWQVQAVSGTPQYNHIPMQEDGVYKNNGLSEIFFFDYVENCPVPAFLMAKTTARGRAEIQWMLQGASSKLFRVEYRKKGSSSPWLSETSYQTSAILSGLENNTEYEYRVGAVCGENKSFDPNDLSQTDAFAYSGVQYFTTNFSNPNKNSAQCGVMPHVDLSNKKPYDRPLTPNEVFTAGDFPVTVITAQGTAGNYTGEGFIQVPYLADTKIKVIFNNIQLNSDKQLINGTVETAYNIEEGNIIDLKSVGELLSELSDIFKKENPTEEDEKKYEEIRQQWEFYFSNIDDIGMSEEDKRKFERIKANMFHASLSKMTAEDRENASKAAKAGQELFKKYEKEFDKLKDSATNYNNPNYNNNPIKINGKKYNLEELIKRTNVIKRKLKRIYNSLTDEEKLILDLPMIEWKLGFKTGAVFILKWLEGKGETIQIPYEFINNDPKYKGIDLKNINQLKNIKYLSLEKLGYTPNNPDAKHLFLYNTNIRAIKNAYDNLQLDIKTGKNIVEIGDKDFKTIKTGETTSKNNFIQSFSLGSPLGDFSDVGAALGRFSQRVYIWGRYNKNNLIIIDKIGTRYADIFTFKDDGFWEKSLRSQDLGCWIDNDDPKKADVTYAKLPFSSKVCLQNNDFIKLKEKSKNINVEIGKDFFIHTPMKIIKNNIIDDVPIP